ncbi:hypothetical protein DY000_02041852 [Brassica cretica]|uniref:Uncharacterized protein n=1 Tax=Brassica cretica TaxID=69181 RepID=A0ABQ7BJ70_BRACR|nr:hypothetical protein DY000_02041852 [Brassica cretica]
MGENKPVSGIALGEKASTCPLPRESLVHIVRSAPGFRMLLWEALHIVLRSLQKEDATRFPDKGFAKSLPERFVTARPLVTIFAITGERFAGEKNRTSSSKKSLILVGIKPVRFIDVESE